MKLDEFIDILTAATKVRVVKMGENPSYDMELYDDLAFMLQNYPSRYEWLLEHDVRCVTNDGAILVYV